MKILKTISEGWKIIAEKIALFQSRLILTLFYFTILLPAGIVFSLFKDVLRIKSTQTSTWISKNNKTYTIETMRKQS